MALPARDVFTFVGEDVWLSEFRLAPWHPDWHASRRTTDAATLIAFPRTSVAIRHEGRTEVVADPTTAVAYGPGQAYRRRLVAPGGDQCTVLAVGHEVVSESAAVHGVRLTADPTYRFPFVATSISSRSFLAIQRIRHRLASGATPDRDAITEELYGVVDDVMRSGKGDERARPTHNRATLSAHEGLAHAVRERVGRDLGVTARLDELAATLNTSPFHLTRVFRSVTGQPVHAYRLELRLRASLGPIADGVRLADVAQQLGFASHAHLTERFVRLYGITPAQWRASLRRNSLESSKIVEASAGRALLA